MAPKSKNSESENITVDYNNGDLNISTMVVNNGRTVLTAGLTDFGNLVERIKQA